MRGSHSTHQVNDEVSVLRQAVGFMFTKYCPPPTPLFLEQKSLCAAVNVTLQISISMILPFLLDQRTSWSKSVMPHPSPPQPSIHSQGILFKLFFTSHS